MQSATKLAYGLERLALTFRSKGRLAGARFIFWCALFLCRLVAFVNRRWNGATTTIGRLKVRESTGEIFLGWGVARIKGSGRALGFERNG